MLCALPSLASSFTSANEPHQNKTLSTTELHVTHWNHQISTRNGIMGFLAITVGNPTEVKGSERQRLIGYISARLTQSYPFLYKTLDYWPWTMNQECKYKNTRICHIMQLHRTLLYLLSSSISQGVRLHMERVKAMKEIQQNLDTAINQKCTKTTCVYCLPQKTSTASKSVDVVYIQSTISS